MGAENEQKRVDEATDNLTDVEIAELANKELKQKEQEIAKLRKELAVSKLYSTTDEDSTSIRMSEEECLKVINNPNSCNYDYANAVIDLYDIQAKEGDEDIWGEGTKIVVDYLRQTVEGCNGNKEAFDSVYQSKLLPDDKEVAMAYQRWKNNINK